MDGQIGQIGHERRDGDEFNAVHAERQIPRADAWRALFERAMAAMIDLRADAEEQGCATARDLDAEIAQIEHDASCLCGQLALDLSGACPAERHS